MHGRAGVYVYAFGYHASTVYGLMGFASAWFNDSWLMGAISWGLLSGLAATVWPIFSSGNKAKSSLVAGVSAAVGMSAGLLPPFALVLDGHPLVAWGYLLQGWGFTGVGVAIVGTGIVAGLVFEARGMALHSHLLIVGLSLLAVAGAASAVPEYRTVDGGVGIDTYFGKPPSNDAEQVERYGEIRQTIRSVSDLGKPGADAHVLVLPENTTSLDDPALDFMVSSDVLRPLQRAGKSAVVGKIGQNKDGEYLNQAVFLSPGRREVVIEQRQPAMLSMWRPWSKEHFPLDWSRDTRIDLGNGEIGRVLICYEEYIPALFLMDEFRGEHSMAIIMSSNWSATDHRLPEVQRLHSLGMAKLFDRPAVRSVNYPRSFKTDADGVKTPQKRHK
ncbi:hypothetical protein P606_13355 [Comamonas thiooxydans]|nr:hypothetical protein P606_13355 [Comamonas thiooxydans]